MFLLTRTGAFIVFTYSDGGIHYYYLLGRTRKIKNNLLYEMICVYCNSKFYRIDNKDGSCYVSTQDNKRHMKRQAEGWLEVGRFDACIHTRRERCEIMMTTILIIIIIIIIIILHDILIR